MASTGLDNLRDKQTRVDSAAHRMRINWPKWGDGGLCIPDAHTGAAGPDNIVVFAALMVNLLTTPFNLNLSLLNYGARSGLLPLRPL